jgi:hypothetical protein
VYPWPAPPPSTRALTVTKWLTVGLSTLLLGLGGVWIRQLHYNLEFLQRYEGYLDDPDAAYARAEQNIVIGYVTVAAIALLAICALCAGLGQRWARVLCVLLLLGPMGVIVYGVVDDGADSLYALAFLVPFGVLLVLWCLPAVTRGLMAKKTVGDGARLRNGEAKTAHRERQPG